MRCVYAAALIAGTLGLTSLPVEVVAVPIKPGVTYKGPERLEATAHGAAYALPAGWTALLPAGQELMMVGVPGLAGQLFIGADAMTVAQARKRMSAATPLGRLVLRPQAKLYGKGRLLHRAYAVAGAAKPMVGYISTAVGANGVGVFVIAIGQVVARAKLRAAAAGLAGSVRFGKRKAKRSTEAKPSGKGWYAALANRQLIRFFHGSGYQEKQSFWLCGNGKFYRQFNAGGSTPGVASGAVQQKGAGRWSARGPFNGGVLTLTYADGSVSRRRLVLNGGKLLVDGKRWYRKASPCR